MSDIDCAEIDQLLGAYVLDATSEDEDRDVESHLPDCRACRQQVDRLRDVTRWLGAEYRIEPPADLRAATLDALDEPVGSATA